MATVEKATKGDVQAVRDLLGMETMPLSEVRKVLDDDLALAKAWAAGVIEVGRRAHCVTGPVGRQGSALVLEDGVEWSGEKTRTHGTLRDLLEDKPPAVEKYKKYETVKGQFGEEPVLKPVEISPSEALAALELQVRLTDKGLGN
jgi:hypothetical protein